MPQGSLLNCVITCLSGLLLLFPNPAGGATNGSAWLARPWQTADGLPNNTVVGVVQTPDRYLWLGTPTGLVRFDGVRFQTFPSSDFVEMPNRGVLMMLGGRDGGLRLAMDRGAMVFLNSDSVRVFSPGSDIPDQPPYMLAEDGAGALWISSRMGSLCRILDGEVTVFGQENGLPEQAGMISLTTDGEGRIWFAKRGEIGVFREGRFETICRLHDTTTMLAAASEGGVWVCSGARLVRLRESGTFEDLGAFPTRASVEPTAMIEDRNGNVWVGTSFDGLFYYDGSHLMPGPVTPRQIMSLTEDCEGNLWVGTTGGGLSRIRARAVVLEGVQSGLPFEEILSLCQDFEGTLWAATQDGFLARRSGDKWQKFSPATNWTAEASCVTADPSGAIWIGTRQSGLFCWNGGRLVNWGNPSDLRGQTIHTLQVSPSGDLWIGEDSPNTVQRLRGGEITTFETGKEDDLRVVRAMTEDARGTLWVGTSRGLLLRAGTDHLIDETGNTTGEPTSIRCLYPTPDGSLWIGYAGWGLGRYKDGRFASIRMDQGLHDDFISHIVQDDSGWMWFGGDRGIFKVRKEELDEVAEGRSSRVRSIQYGRGEGLPSLQATFGSAPAAMRSMDGRIWIPTRTALVVIDPKRMSENADPPPVLLNRLVVDDRMVASYNGVIPHSKSSVRDLALLETPESQLRLPPGHRRIQFEFAALSFTAPDNIHFRHRLEGLDEDWVEDETERIVNYSRLSHGKYRFLVNASNGEGVWSDSPATLSFVVRPFFYQTWLFRITVLALFTLAVVAVVRYVSFRRLRLQLRRFEQQEALHHERARIAKDIHDDVGANLTQIAFLGELAQQDWDVPGKAGERIETISRTARQAVRSLDEIVWAVNPRNDTLAHLIDYAGQFALDYLRLANIRCRLDLPEQTPEREVSTDIRHNLFLVVKEALNNIVKHAHATEVWFRVHVTEEKLRLVIEDNGRGFKTAPDNATEDGLRNMRQRLSELGGHCEIRGSVGEGVRITAELTWRDQRGY